MPRPTRHSPVCAPSPGAAAAASRAVSGFAPCPVSGDAFDRGSRLALALKSLATLSALLRHGEIAHGGPLSEVRSWRGSMRRRRSVEAVRVVPVAALRAQATGLSPPVDQVRSQNATWVEASWGDKTFDFPIASTEIGSAPEAGRGRPGILGSRRPQHHDPWLICGRSALQSARSPVRPEAGAGPQGERRVHRPALPRASSRPSSFPR